MKITIEKPSPKWIDVIDDKGKKWKKRVLGILGYVEKVDFPDALAFDGAQMELLRPFDYEKMQMERDFDEIPQDIFINSTIIYLEGIIADLREKVSDNKSQHNRDKEEV